MGDQLSQRRIRSFVRREGRLTRAQQRALRTLWVQYGVDAGAGVIDLDGLYGRAARHVLEIGFGNGENLAVVAAAHPENDYLGIEVHRPGVGSLLLRLESAGLHNVRVICADAVEILEHHLSDASLDAVYVFFPDPWPKKRHHKRRLVQAPTVALLARKLKPGGRLCLATDWEDYAQQMLRVIGASNAFRNVAGVGTFATRPPERPLTRFERRGQQLGHAVWDLVFERVRDAR